MTETQQQEDAMYHADVSRIGKSGLDLIAQSPAHYWAKYLDPKREREKETSALITGRAVHAAILEPHVFHERFVIEPEINKRTNDGREAYAKFMHENARKTIISMDTYDQCQRMREAVYKHPAAMELIQNGVAEKRIDFTEPNTSAPCKCKPDFLSESGFIVDIKTTEDASREAFGRSSFKYRYHVQAAFYCDGLTLATGNPPKGFVFIAVEKNPPYAVAVYFVDEPTFTLGRDTYLRDVEVYMRCATNNEWPAYGDMVTALQLPTWAFRQTFVQPID